MVEETFVRCRPTVVFHLAAKVGGIYANIRFKSAFYRDNVLINTHVVDACERHAVRYVFAMGTGCAYPKRLEEEPLIEDAFLDGIPEATNDAYAYAKRGLLVHLQALKESGKLDYTYCLPSNIYGPHDNFHPEHSHVVPGLIRRFCDAADAGQPAVSVWGDGRARRDFLYVDDLVDATLLLARSGASGVYNVATARLTSVGELATTIREAAGYRGDIRHDTSLPVGQRQRIFDIRKVSSLGWAARTPVAEGVRRTVAWFREAGGSYRAR